MKFSLSLTPSVRGRTVCVPEQYISHISRVSSITFSVMNSIASGWLHSPATIQSLSGLFAVRHASGVSWPVVLFRYLFVPCFGLEH